MLKKLDRPIVWRTLFACFFAGFGFAAGEAVQRVNDACALNAVCPPKNIFELAADYFDPRVMVLTIVFTIVVIVEAGFSLYQLRLKRQVMLAIEKAAGAAREFANEKTAILVSLNGHGLESELLRSIIEQTEWGADALDGPRGPLSTEGTNDRMKEDVAKSRGVAKQSARTLMRSWARARSRRRPP